MNAKFFWVAFDFCLLQVPYIFKEWCEMNMLQNLTNAPSDGFWGMFTVNTNWHHFCKHRRSRSVAAWYKQEKIGVNYHILTAFGTLCQCLTANTFVFTMCCAIEYVCSKQVTKVVDVEFGKMQFSTVRMELILESMANHTAVCEEIPHTRWPTAVSSYEMQTSLLFIILFYFIYI